MTAAAIDYHSSPMAEAQDYKQMIFEMQESIKKFREESPKKKEYIPKTRKVNFLDEDLTLND